MWKSISQRFCGNLSIKSPYHRPCLTTFFLCFITKQHFWYRICLVHDVVTKPRLVPNHINNIQYQTKPHYVNCIREIVSFEGFKQLVPVWFQNVMYHFSFLLFYIQILNLKKKLKKKKKKTTLVMFGKLF